MRVLRLLPTLVALAILSAGAPVWAHPMPSSQVLLHLHQTGVVAEVTLPIGELALGWGEPLPEDAAETVRAYGDALRAYVGAHVHALSPDGRPWTVSVGEVRTVDAPNDVEVALTMAPPPGAPTDRLTLFYDVIFHRLVTHTALVSLGDDFRGGVVGTPPLLLGALRDTSPSLVIDRSGGSWSRGFAATFRLGMRHIAEGTDHLLFLLALLLPAPLRASYSPRRWGAPLDARRALRRIVGVVSAFTIGHSVTLALAAAGWVSLPAAFVETAIALSIVASAVQALVPAVGEREAYLAGGFGLVHGLAFAATLSGFRFDAVTMASSVLGFNLGIEAMQIAVLLVVLPSLVLLARTPLYTPLRVTGASVTGIAAVAWALERALGWKNPIGPALERAASHGVWLIAGLAALSLTATLAPRLEEASRRIRMPRETQRRSTQPRRSP
jgi:HupE / UreJ protein